MARQFLTKILAAVGLGNAIEATNNDASNATIKGANANSSGDVISVSSVNGKGVASLNTGTGNAGYFEGSATSSAVVKAVNHNANAYAIDAVCDKVGGGAISATGTATNTYPLVVQGDNSDYLVYVAAMFNNRSTSYGVHSDHNAGTGVFGGGPVDGVKGQTGNGNGVHGKATGNTGKAGFFEQTAAAATSEVVNVTNAGTGSALNIIQSNPAATAAVINIQNSSQGSSIIASGGNTSQTIFANNLNAPGGIGVLGQNGVDAPTGTSYGVKGIQLATSGSAGAGVYGTDQGTSAAISDGVWGRTSGSGNAIRGTASGTGYAGLFQGKVKTTGNLEIGSGACIVLDAAGNGFPSSPSNGQLYYHPTWQCLFVYKSTVGWMQQSVPLMNSFPSTSGLPGYFRLARYDRGMLTYFWDGTYWLTEQLFDIPLVPRLTMPYTTNGVFFEGNVKNISKYGGILFTKYSLGFYTTWNNTASVYLYGNVNSRSGGSGAFNTIIQVAANNPAYTANGWWYADSGEGSGYSQPTNTDLIEIGVGWSGSPASPQFYVNHALYARGIG